MSTQTHPKTSATPKFKSDFLQYIYERGFLYQASDLEALDELLAQQQICAYIGFDCTADKLHVGSLVQIMLLRALEKFGHKAIVLLGSGTTLVGDPSGKDKSRSMLTPAQIEANKFGLTKVLQKFINPQNVLFTDNASWLSGYNYLNFLREFGPLFTINRMLTFDSVSLRLDREQPLTFLEFNYMLLQAVDFLHLHQTNNVLLQLGGSDQWGNIVNGIDLIRRVTGHKAFGVTSPLITTSGGVKMGKTQSGAIWLSETENHSAWDYYQFWRNTEDKDVIRFLKLFTELPLEEIHSLAKLEHKELNEAKKILAYQATALCFGEEEAQKYSRLAAEIFEQKISSSNLPILTLSRQKLAAQPLLLANFLVECGLMSSSSQARKLIENQGVKLNGKTVIDSKLPLSLEDLEATPEPTLSLGKKKHYALRLDEP